MEKSLVLLSGGLDSAVALRWAMGQGWDVRALTFNYHQRPTAELRACRALLADAGLGGLTEIDLPFLREVSDLEDGIGNAALPAAPRGYVPARNLIFYSLALNRAEILGARYVVGGHNSGDSHVFPDASPRFFAAVNELGRIGLWSWEASPVEVVVPLSGLGKERVLQLGLELGVRFEHTWSCYSDGPAHCGLCESCQERQEAFRNLGLVDPVPYARPPGLGPASPEGQRRKLKRSKALGPSP